MITNAEITRYMALSKKKKTEKLNAAEQEELSVLKATYVASLQNNEKTSVNDADLARISVLSRKYRGEGLSEEEEKEYVTLRLAYVIASRRNVAGQVNNIDLVDKNGRVENLGEKYGRNK